MPSTSLTPDQQAQAITSAANHWGVPPQVLMGIYGAETSWGANISTSSAGAMGAFQFIPSTAAGYNYPMTNTPDASQFAQQADAAAKLLHDAHKSGGSDWTDAIFSYNHSSAYVAEVGNLGKPSAWPAKLRAALSGAFQTSQVGSSVVNVPNPLKGLDAIGNFFNALVDPHTWLRVAMGVGALVLITYGLYELAGAKGDELAGSHGGRAVKRDVQTVTRPARKVAS